MNTFFFISVDHISWQAFMCSSSAKSMFVLAICFRSNKHRYQLTHRYAVKLSHTHTHTHTHQSKPFTAHNHWCKIMDFPCNTAIKANLGGGGWGGGYHKATNGFKLSCMYIVEFVPVEFPSSRNMAAVIHVWAVGVAHELRACVCGCT